MAWISGTEERTYMIDAPSEDVIDFFCNPERFKEAFGQLESAEEVEPNVWTWTLVEKAEKGIRFQGVYTVEYTREGDVGTWDSRAGTNSSSKGRVSCRALGALTEVTYSETLGFDLPIPKLAAKLFRPIVAREIRHGVGEFLDSAKEILEG